MMVGEPPPAAGDDGWVPPDELDGFRVVRQLGRGGMGAVYLGHDDMLDRPVALKFLSAADPNAPARDRFLVEARAIARLQHPNVVGIYRIGEVLGRPYLAYELISGQSLDALVKPVPWPRALDLVLGVSRGLAAAHRRDVLHRDIKPANVMLSEAGEIKLLDFGLAKLLDATQPDAGGAAAAAQAAAALTGRAMSDAMSDATLDASLSARTTRVVRGAGARGTGPEDALTATGAILGTPLYMAPELWRGEPATVQSDVYALGLLLYELLSGRLPHEGLRAAEIAEAVQTRDPPPIRSLCPTLPQALADVVDRAIRRRRDERFQSAQEVRDALEAIRSLYRPFGRRFGEPPGEPPGPALDGDGGGTPGAPTPAAAGVAGDDDAPLITASFARIAPRADAFSARVYERLFAEHPELRAMFPIEMAGQRRKLLGALIAIVDNLQAPDRLVLLLEDLGRRHAVYGVRPENFDAVGAALLGAIGDFDDAIAEPVLAAWTRAYARIAQAMQRGLAAERVTVPPGPPGSPDSNAALAGELAPTRYARNGDVGLAYQVIGNGAIDVVLVSGELTHLDAGWLWSPVTRFLRALAGLGRLIVYDGRGTGLSDADAGPGALLEDRMADLRAVLDAAGVERAALIGIAAGAAPAVLFAATHPERTRALVLYAPNARGTAGDGHPHGPSAADHDAAIAEMRAAWGEPLFLDRIAPSVSGSAAFRSHWARYLRTAASPSAAIAHHRALAAFDVRAVLPAIRVPALVLHRDGDAAVPIAAGRAVAESIPGAQFVALAGRDHLSFVGDTAAIVGEIRRFLARARRPADTTWLLAAVVAFAPGSAPVDEAVALACEREVARFRGVELACLGDGRASAMFDGPGRAVRFARAVVRRARALGVALAAGVSFDMCRFGDTDVDGAAVQLAPRVAARAAPGQILVSDGAQALLGGAIALAPHGELDGIRLHAVIGGAD
jgi:serine/threonine protein kinase/pimeloyl-ACP methyl ester carboxylesterase/hemoglobin-like flavoprotein